MMCRSIAVVVFLSCTRWGSPGICKCTLINVLEGKMIVCMTMFLLLHHMGGHMPSLCVNE